MMETILKIILYNRFFYQVNNYNSHPHLESKSHHFGAPFFLSVGRVY